MIWTLFVAMNLANAADLWTTIIGMSYGAKEGNPVGAYVIDRIGLKGLVVVKLLFGLAISLSAALTEAVTAMCALTAIYACVSVHNYRLARSLKR